MAPIGQNPLTIEATRTWNELTGGMVYPSDVYSINKAIVTTLERYQGQMQPVAKAAQKRKKAKKQSKASTEQKVAAKPA